MSHSPRKPSFRSTLSPADIIGPPLTQVPSIHNGGYDYFKDLGPAPDVALTGPPLRRADTTFSQDFGPSARQSPLPRSSDAELRIYKRKIDGGWRIQLPVELQPHEPAPTSTQPPGTQQATAPGHNASLKVHKILRNWKVPTDTDPEADTLPTLRCLGGVPNAQGDRTSQPAQYITWAHKYQHVMNRSDFEKLVLGHIDPSLDPGIEGLTKRLLKRVHTTAERHYIRGKFLLPTAIRYDGLSKTAAEQERPCLFFNFPYLSIDHHHATSCKECPKRMSDNFPLRSLFQFRYRLQTTTAKDSSQVVTNVAAKTICKCLPENTRVSFMNACKKEAPLVHVPQVWIALIDRALVCTSGPLRDESLCGPVVKMEQVLYSNTDSRVPGLVRIIFDRSGTTEYFTFPTSQCNWWFGLLNKQLLILRHFNTLESDSHKDGSNDSDTKQNQNRVTMAKDASASLQDYMFCRDETPNGSNDITIQNWPEVLLRAAGKGERLDIWLRQITKPDITVSDPDASSLADAAKSTSSATMVSPAATPVAHTPRSTAASGLAHSVSATSSLTRDRSRSNRTHPRECFLSWPILDGFANPDESGPIEKARRILAQIYCDFCKDHYSILSAESGNRRLVRSFSDPGAAGAQPEGELKDLTYSSIRRLLLNSKTSLTGDTYDILLEVLDRCRSVLHFYIPASERDASDQGPARLDEDAVLLFWSLVRTIVLGTANDAIHMSTVRKLANHIKEIERLASELHVGTELISTDQDEDASPMNRVLLEVMVKGLSHTFDLLAVMVKQIGAPPTMATTLDIPWNRATEALATAKNQLIVEADDPVHEKGRGSIATPEAVVMMLLERLSAGVYKEESIELLEIYEQAVEKIALKLDSEKGASRRLLLKINGIAEELDIVQEVLRQQHSVLKMFRYALNPKSFDRRSVSRQIDFNREVAHIDRIIQTVDSRRVDCEDLKDRTSRLARQNVELIDAQQDDNGKAIMVFTIVTVLFLPPSFVSSYFGMNLDGIGNTTAGPGHFWYIAAPVTVGITALCVTIVYLSTIKRKWRKWRDKRREGSGSDRY